MSSSDLASAWLLVVLCAVSGAYCLRQVRRSGGAAAGEAVMAFGMALMAVPLGDRDGWQALALGAVFCAAALHGVWLLRGGAHHAHHLVGSLAMAYMALTAAGYGHGGGPSLVTGLLLLYFAGYVLLGGARLVAAGGGAQGSYPVASAELSRACRLAMGMGMLAMLLMM
ncbi:DUF5134 domain-containing protein [Streptomyces sp. NPDC048270]|uniref:DUF5134 domain-containing protein n=1 Tax=Streptomyces sp. NPDC048270 TaxID=3154615 RepID=UPI0033CED2C0